MKLIFILLLLTSGALAQNGERCSRAQLLNTNKASQKICNDNIHEFALRSSVSCLVSKYEMKSCRAECKDADKKSFASLRVDMFTDCGRGEAVYQRMGIKYFR